MKIEMVIFDMDGTLIDSERVFWDIWLKTGAEYNAPIDEAFLISLTGSSHAEEQKLILKDDKIAQIYPLIKERINSRFAAIVSNKIDIAKDGLYQLLDYLIEHDIKFSVASNSGLVHVSGLFSTLDPKYQPLFSGFVSAEEVAKGKPHPDVFLEAARRFAIDPAHCIVVEDSHTGLKGAKAANMRTVLIEDLMPITAAMENDADYIIQNHQEIIEIIQSIHK